MANKVTEVLHVLSRVGEACLVLKLPVAKKGVVVLGITESAALEICKINLPERLALIIGLGLCIHREEVGVVVVIFSALVPLDEVIAVELGKLHSAELIAEGEAVGLVGKGFSYFLAMRFINIFIVRNLTVIRLLVVDLNDTICNGVHQFLVVRGQQHTTLIIA